MKTKINLERTVREVTITMDYEEYITLMAVLFQARLDTKDEDYYQDLCQLFKEFDESEKTYVWDEI